jgi:tetratricopeptide (TPR) repeat protein
LVICRRTGPERLPEAEALLEEARAAWGRVTVTYGQPFDAYLRFYLGGAALVRGDVDTARAHYEASATELEAAGDDTTHGAVLGGLGVLAAQRGEHAAARATFAQALPLLRPGADQCDLALLLLNSGLEEAQAESPAAWGLLGAARALLPATHPLLRVTMPYDLPARLCRPHGKRPGGI